MRKVCLKKFFKSFRNVKNQMIIKCTLYYDTLIERMISDYISEMSVK